MYHQQLTQPRHSATLQGCDVPQSTCRTVGLSVTYPSLSQCTLDTNHTPVVPACSTCPCSFTCVIAPNTLQSRGKARIGHRNSVSTRVQHVISIIHRALQQSIERDKERTVNIMNLIVTDKQRWNFIAFSWIVALHSCTRRQATSLTLCFTSLVVLVINPYPSTEYLCRINSGKKKL